MALLPLHIQQKLEQAASLGLYRKVAAEKRDIDFSSNNYLGLPSFSEVQNIAGSGGSRLITGTHNAHLALEDYAANSYGCAALLFNSGYAANLGILQAIPQRQDLILYDEAVHASMRDGMLLSKAQHYAFTHNQPKQLEAKLKKYQANYGEVYILCESLYSMSGQAAPLQDFTDLANEYKAWLIIDEAHGAGWQNHKNTEFQDPRVLARVLALGKAYNSIGAFILGSKELKDYLINFSRSFIYTTALPSAIVEHIQHNIDLVFKADDQRKQLKHLIGYWCKNAAGNATRNPGPIQFLYLPLEKHEEASNLFAEEGIDVRSIRYPTVKKGNEGFRVVLHSYNSCSEISLLNQCIKKL